MKTYFVSTICIVFLLCVNNLNAVSLVYNLRIAETTRRQASEQQKTKPSTVVGVLVNQYRTTKNDIHQFITGGVGTYIYSTESTFFRIDIGGGHIEENPAFLRRIDSKNQMDDIMISMGYGQALTRRSKLAGSVLLGIPTHKDTGLAGVIFGTGHVGVGIQVDGSYFVSEKDAHAFLAAARIVHFVPRNASLQLNGLKTIFKVFLGNVVDLLVSYQGGLKRHRYETGYSASFSFNAHLQPTIPDINISTTVIRSSFYGNYKFLYPINGYISALGLGISYGFDHRPKIVGFKNIVTLWGAWGINF